VIAPGSFRMDAYSIETGERPVVDARLASEMKSTPVLEGETLYTSGYNTPENDPGRQVIIRRSKRCWRSRMPITTGKFPWRNRRTSARRILSLHGSEPRRRSGCRGVEDLRLHHGLGKRAAGPPAGWRGDLTGTSLLWKYHRSIPQLPSPLLYRDVLYMINDTGVLTLLDPKTGEVKEQSRLRGLPGNTSPPRCRRRKVFFVSQACE